MARTRKDPASASSPHRCGHSWVECDFGMLHEKAAHVINQLETHRDGTSKAGYQPWRYLVTFLQHVVSSAVRPRHSRVSYERAVSPTHAAANNPSHNAKVSTAHTLIFQPELVSHDRRRFDVEPDANVRTIAVATGESRVAASGDVLFFKCDHGLSIARSVGPCKITKRLAGQRLHANGVLIVLVATFDN